MKTFMLMLLVIAVLTAIGKLLHAAECVVTPYGYGC